MLAFVGIDDTDAKEAGARGSGRGTGRVAREAACELIKAGFKVRWVLRHQLVSREFVRTPGNNSSKSITLEVCDEAEALDALNVVESVVRELSSPESNAGIALCTATPPPPKALKLAEGVKVRLVSIDEVYRAAEECGVELRPVLGDGSGVVGAFAAAVLAATGNDGRVLDIPATGLRRYKGMTLSVAELLKLGISEVRSTEGRVLRPEEVVRAEDLKPVMRCFKPVLYVRREGGVWVAVRVE